jgi:hypothetical protein
MERRNGLCLTGAVLALGIAAIPAMAQNQTNNQTGTMNRDRIMSMQNDMNWDRTLPASPAQDKMVLLQMMSDKGFSKADIMKALPLLEDLRDAENMYTFGMEDASTYWATLPDQSKLNGMDMARDAANHFRDRRNQIWGALDAAIGADKSSALRPLVEPTRVDVSTYAYTDQHIQRIDQLISDWDRLAAARVAANGTAAGNNANTVSVETTTTTTTTTTSTLPGIDVYTFPTMTTQDLVDVMEMRLAALEANGDPAAIIAVRGHELNSKNLQFLREKSLKYWD